MGTRLEGPSRSCCDRHPDIGSVHGEFQGARHPVRWDEGPPQVAESPRQPPAESLVVAPVTPPGPARGSRAAVPPQRLREVSPVWRSRPQPRSALGLCATIRLRRGKRLPT